MPRYNQYSLTFPTNTEFSLLYGLFAQVRNTYQLFFTTKSYYNRLYGVLYHTGTLTCSELPHKLWRLWRVGAQPGAPKKVNVIVWSATIVCFSYNILYIPCGSKPIMSRCCPQFFKTSRFNVHCAEKCSNQIDCIRNKAIKV